MLSPRKYSTEQNNHKLARHDGKNVFNDLAAEITGLGSNSYPSIIHVNLPLLTYPSLVPSDLHPQLFRLITLNVILIKNCGVKGFSLPEKRVQIVAQWRTPSLAWEEMHPDIARMVPNDRSQIKQRVSGPFEYDGITFFLERWVIRNICVISHIVTVGYRCLLT